MVTIRQPKPGDDRVPAVSLSIVTAIGLASGLGLAHAAMGALPPPGYVEEEGAASSEVRYDAPPAEPTADDTPADATMEPSADSPTDAPIEAPVTDDEATTPTELAVPAEPSEPEAPVAVPAAPTTPSVAATGPRPGTHVRRGRVAYLRCDGAPQQAGPFPCPRDEVFETFVWSAIDSLETCATPVSPGQADLVVDFERDESPTPTILTRDTFRDDVQRADAAAIVTCLTPTLATATSSIPGERLRVGFRFEVE